MIIKSGYKSINGDYIFSKTEKAVRQFRESNPNVTLVDLGVGDVRLPVPKAIARKMRKAAYELSKEETFSGYPPDFGYGFLRKAISEYYKMLGADISVDEVFITAGAKPALADIVSLADFSKAFIHQPNYPLYKELCAASGIPFVTADCSPGKGQKIVQNNGCDLCFVCSPCNPTGKKADSDDIAELAKSQAETGGVIIIDAAYAFFDEKYTPPFSTAAERKSVVEVRTFSKSLSFTGVRCGFVVIAKENPLYDPFKKMMSLKYNGVNVTAQRAALAAFSFGRHEEFVSRREYYRKNAEVLAAPFVCRGYAFSGGIFAPYLFVNVGSNGFYFAEDLLNAVAVCVTPGEAFGGENCVRLSCLCTAEDAEEGAKRIGRFLDRRARPE